MTLHEGDEVVTDSGETFRLGQHMAYRGKEGCTDAYCSRGPGWPDRCYGWHCPVCHGRTNMMGHHNCPGAPS